MFVAVANNLGLGNKVMNSSDGLTWTIAESPNAYELSSVTYGNGLFVAVVGNAIRTNQVMISTNGTNWTNVQGSDAKNWTSVAYGNDKFVAVSKNNTENKVMYADAVLGQNDLSRDKVSIYPNPASDRLFIKMPDTGADDNATAKLYDLQGRLVRESIINNEDFSIDLNGLGSSVYNLHVAYGNVNLTKRIIVTAK